MSKYRSEILGVGSYLPPRIVTNFDFAPKFAIAELGVVNDVNTMKTKM